MKNYLMLLTASCLLVTVRAGVATHLKLDCRTGVRECAADGEPLRYDAGWYENGTEARITENGTVVTSGTVGVYNWHPASSCSTRHVLTLDVLSDGQVVGTETAEFESEATLAHSEVVTTVARAATCTEDGCTKGAYCSRCNEVLATTVVLPALGHVEVVTTVARAATCTEDGCTKGTYCSRCNAALTVSEPLPALGGEHLGAVTKSAVEPTSGMTGMTAEITCSRCGKILQTATEIPALGYVRDVTARQLWPHNKVALSFTVAADIGEVKGAHEDLTVWCARSWLTNVATRIIGDRSAKPGVHRIVWDVEADGLRFVNDKTTFGVSVESIEDSGVQLWENGPYWAECNVGASKPEEYGYYFWWGDTVGYKRNAANNGWVSVKDGVAFSFSSGNCPTYGKDNSWLQSAGYIDATGNLVAAHDAATAHLGAPWRMPTDAEMEALISNCTTTWTVRNGVYGRLVTGKGAYASKSIFLPAAGFGYASYLDNAGSLGYCWSSSPYSDYSYFACYLYFLSGNFNRYYNYRYLGQSVRPLRGFAK